MHCSTNPGRNAVLTNQIADDVMEMALLDIANHCAVPEVAKAVEGGNEQLGSDHVCTYRTSVSGSKPNVNNSTLIMVIQ